MAQKEYGVPSQYIYVDTKTIPPNNETQNDDDNEIEINENNKNGYNRNNPPKA